MLNRRFLAAARRRRIAAEETKVQPGLVSAKLRRRMGDALADIFDEHGIQIYSDVVGAIRTVLTDNFKSGVEKVEGVVKEELGNRGLSESQIHFKEWLKEVTGQIVQHGLDEMQLAIEDIANDLTADYTQSEPTAQQDVEDLLSGGPESDVETVNEEDVEPAGDETEVPEEEIGGEEAVGNPPGDIGNLLAQPTASSDWRRRRMVREPRRTPRISRNVKRKSADLRSSLGPGRYVDTKLDNAGNLVITPTKEFFEEYENFAQMGSRDALIDILEDYVANGRLDFVLPEEVGALTDAPILTDERVTDDNGNVIDVGTVWWHEAYQVEDPIEALHDRRKLIFNLAEKAENNKETPRISRFRGSRYRKV